MQPTITFPHAGDYWIAFEYFFRKLGFKVVVPPKSSRESLDLGIRHAPLQACIPFKHTLGNLIQGMEQGAHLFAMIGGKTGICRLKYYGEMYCRILRDLGYTVELFPFKLKKEMWDAVKRFRPGVRLRDFIKYFYGFLLKMRLVEIVRESALGIRPFEKEPGRCSRLFNESIALVHGTDDIRSLRRLRHMIPRKFAAIPVDASRRFVRIGVVGEFFLLIDQFSTLNFESFLGRLGCIVEPSLNFTEFFYGAIKQVRALDKVLPTMRHRIARYAAPYIDRPIGGHARESVGQTIRFSREQYDGVIQVYPFTCMPEIVASSILPQVSVRHAIPVLSLCFDEQTGEAGLQTRLEAFVDMLFRRKYRSAADAASERGRLVLPPNVAVAPRGVAS